MFYRWIEPTRQGVGAVVCAGTSFLVRRSALEQVGGFETGTPSEDLATGIRLSAAGHRILYLNEKLSAGLAPPNLAAMARQRSRWASGTLQTLRTTANPLVIPGLNPLQRLALLEGILHWFNVIPQLVLVLMPLSFGLLGVPPLVLPDQGALSVALPLLLAQVLLVRWFSHGARSALMPELYGWIFVVPVLLAVLDTVLGRPRPFQVTPKETPLGRPAPAPWLVWSCLAIGSLLAAVRACWDRYPSDAVVWFRPVHAQGVLEQGPRRWAVRLTAISERGVELSWSAADPGGELPQPHRPLLIHADCLGTDSLALRLEQVRSSGGRVQLGALWLWRSQAEAFRLQGQLYQQPGASGAARPASRAGPAEAPGVAFRPGGLVFPQCLAYLFPAHGSHPHPAGVGVRGSPGIASPVHRSLGGVLPETRAGNPRGDAMGISGAVRPFSAQPNAPISIPYNDSGEPMGSSFDPALLHHPAGMVQQRWPMP